MKFLLGCNYWASHAGTDMWVNWNAEQIEKDFKVLEQNNINTLRVFINWRDFQPVVALHGGGNYVKEYLMKDLSKPVNPYYLDEEMLNRFGYFCDLAEKHNFKLIVGIVTGWMSGRMFAPPALEGRNTYTDPLSVKFQIKLVTGIVSRFKDKKAIYAWDLGNECNCMSTCNSSEVAYNWSSLIANTIRANDNTRPVISGMHSLAVQNASWLIEDQGETTDMLTTHPYAFFVKHCSMDPANSIRTLMHGTTETILYSDISKKPCLVEELGTLSNSICSDEISADFMRINLLSNWAENSPGVLWWCAHEQSHLSNPPYNWCTLERELGMLDKDMKPKKYLLEMKEFASWLNKTGLKQSKPETDSAIILTRNSDAWGLAYMSFILAKQAGLEPEFVSPNSHLPKKKAYIMPSTCGDGCIRKEYYEELKENVYNGATLYVSNSNAFFTEFKEFFGLEVQYNEQISSISGTFTLDGSDIPYSYNQRRVMKSAGATVLNTDSLDNPLLSEHNYGKGKVIFLNFPMEEKMLNEPYAFDKGREKVYQYAFRDIIESKSVIAKNSHAIVTKAGNTVTVLNLTGEAMNPMIILNGVTVDKIYRNSLENIPSFDGTVFTVK